MRKVMLVGAMLLATATTASAAGLNLRWQDCAGDGGTQNRTFACTNNLGSNVLAGSFILDSDLALVDGDELVVDLVSAGPTLVDWWRFNTFGSCRQLSLTIAAQDGAGCPDPFRLAASMNIAAYPLERFGPNSARILCVNAVLAADITDLAGGQEYGVAKWTINNAKSVGAGSCAGCQTPVCIVFNVARILGPAGVRVQLTTEAAPGSNFCTWQGGGGTNCPAATPTKNTSWGSVKSLYR